MPTEAHRLGGSCTRFSICPSVCVIVYMCVCACRQRHFLTGLPLNSLVVDYSADSDLKLGYCVCCKCLHVCMCLLIIVMWHVTVGTLDSESRNPSSYLGGTLRQFFLPWVLWRCWLGGKKGIWLVKNWVLGCWCGYLSGARCRLVYGPADAIATHCLLL